MPITFEQFENQFDKLQAAFTVTKSSKIIDRWYQEFQKCEHGPFCIAMRRLQHGERFPNWGLVWSEYRNCLGPVSKLKKNVGCRLCISGTVFYRDYVQQTDEVKDLVAVCILCSADNFSGLNHIDPRILVKDSIGILRTPSGVEHDKKGGAMIKTPNRKPANGMEIAQAILGRDNPKNEEIRKRRLYAESRREGTGTTNGR